MLTAETARQQSRMGERMEAHSLPEWSALAVYLRELSRNDGWGREELGPAADWAPWLQTLPRKTGCVLEWSQAEACAHACCNAASQSKCLPTLPCLQLSLQIIHTMAVNVLYNRFQGTVMRNCACRLPHRTNTAKFYGTHEQRRASWRVDRE